MVADRDQPERDRQREERVHHRRVPRLEAASREEREREPAEQRERADEPLPADAGERAQVDVDAPLVVARPTSATMASSTSGRTSVQPSIMRPPAKSMIPSAAFVGGLVGESHGVPVCCIWYANVGSHGTNSRQPTAIASRTLNAVARSLVAAAPDDPELGHPDDARRGRTPSTACRAVRR